MHFYKQLCKTISLRGSILQSIFINVFLWILGHDERDIVILRHEFIIRWPDNTREEKGVNFVVYGKPANEGGQSAMALTVGYPTAIATKMLLDGEIQERGVILPFANDVFIPILSRLRAEGFNSTYSSRIIS